jgi:hypothetical protein
MNPQLKAKWISALRGGRYIQGEGALNQNGKFCCLGVLADLMGMKSENNPGFETEITYDTIDRLLGSSKLREKFIQMNDGTMIMNAENGNYAIDKKTFSEIADYIEEVIL